MTTMTVGQLKEVLDDMKYLNSFSTKVYARRIDIESGNI
jgi:hypothetical protein